MSKKLKIWLKITMVAALYATLSLAVAPYAFGSVQIRISEALTVLPLLGIWPIWALTLGCALTNLIGAASGFNILGYWDVLWGTLASLIAAFLTYKTRKIYFKKIPIVALIMPVLINSLIIGAELMLVIGPNNLWGFLFYALSVAIGEGISVFVLGYPLFQILNKTKLFKTET